MYPFRRFEILIPQTVLNCRGSDGLVKGPVLVGEIGLCGYREGHIRHSQLKWSLFLFSFTRENHDGFASFCLQDASHAPGAPGSRQGAPGEPRRVSQMIIYGHLTR